MATYAGQIHSYSNTLPQKRTVTDRIIMADVYNIVPITVFGLNNESKFSFVNTPGKMYEWLEDTYAATTTTANDTDLTNDSTITTVTVASGAVFHVGDVITMDSEYMWVSAISGNDLTVTRNFGGTQATHESTGTITIRYNSRLEGATASDSPNTEVSTGYNYSTILQASIEVSRTDGRIPQYGIPNVVDREIDKKMDELMMKLCKIPYHGQRKVGSTTAPRSSGGLATFITTNVTNAASAALTRKHIEDAVEDCFNYGGNPSMILCGSWASRKINSFYEGFVKTERAETMGGMMITKLLTVAGITLDVVVDRFCPADKLFILDKNYVGYITIDDFFYEDLAKTKDTAGYGQVVGEYGFVTAHEKAHAYIHTFSTTA